MSQQLPNPDTVNQSVTRLEQFVAYIVEVLRGNNWTRKLLLLDVLIFLIFNPISFKRILELFSIINLPNRYGLCFWILVGAVFGAAVIASWRVLPREKHRLDLAERTAIKGLLPYGTSDAALFVRLQRENDLTECFQAITAREFRFGVLCGESGNGKTSFLKAGLQPRLPERGHRCVYVKCTDLDPVEAIRQTLLEQLQLDKNRVPSTLPEMLETVAGLDSRPLILILDQFEQFFVHRQRKKDRALFLTAMETWFKRQAALPVKILICLRSDFLDRLIEVQKLLGYSLGPHQNFRLEKFAPAQAAEIFRVIAEQEKLKCDSDFVEKLAAEELASTNDGLVSPVDIQVLAWMIAGQKLEKERAFNEKAFRNLGGVEGLLERFLNRALEARETDVRRQAAVKVLLALTDLDRNTRAGVLTMTELEEKLKNQLSPGEIAEAVQWLSRGDVRLIMPIKRKLGGKEVEGYELAHERLIPALRRIAGKQLVDADRAEQLLGRRTNEWLGNGRHSRYLFSWRELRLINKYKKLITWGKERQAKEALLKASRQRLRFRYAAAGLALLLVFVGWQGWQSNAWQIWLIKRDLRNYGRRLGDDRTLGHIALAFEYAGDSQQASEVLNRIVDKSSKTAVLMEMAEFFAKVGEKAKATAFLAEAVKTAGLIGDDDKTASALISISSSYGNLKKKMTDISPLAEAVKMARLIHSDTSKVRVLVGIAESYAKLGEEGTASSLLAEAGKVSAGITDQGSKNSALSAIADSYGHIGETLKNTVLVAEGLKIEEMISDNKVKGFSLRANARSYAELGAKENALALLAKAVKIAALIDDGKDKAFAMGVISRTYADLAVRMKDRGLIVEAIKTAELTDNYDEKAGAQRDIADAYSKLGEKERATEKLAEAIKTAVQIDGDMKQIHLHLISESYAEMGVLMNDEALLLEAIKTVGLIDTDFSKAEALSSIALSYAKLAETKNDGSLVAEAIKTARLIGGGRLNDSKGEVLAKIAETCAKLGKREQARELLTEAVKTVWLMELDRQRGYLLGNITESYAKTAELLNDHALYDQTFGFIDSLGDDDSKDSVLDSILSTRWAVYNVGKLSALTSRYSENRRPHALARILMIVSHPELIGKEEEAQDNDD
jgi:tetratricopeptide (TPR) repeat protein